MGAVELAGIAKNIAKAGTIKLTDRVSEAFNAETKPIVKTENPNSTITLTDAEAGSPPVKKIQDYSAQELGVEKNALKPHEIVQAKNMVHDIGGSFEGVPDLKPGMVLKEGFEAVTRDDYPVIDGWYTTKGGEKTAVSLKLIKEGGAQKILGFVKDANNAGIRHGVMENATMYIDAPHMSSAYMKDFMQNSPLVNKEMLTQGLINQVVIRTKEGFYTVRKGSIKSGVPENWK